MNVSLNWKKKKKKRTITLNTLTQKDELIKLKAQYRNGKINRNNMTNNNVTNINLSKAHFFVAKF